MQLSVFLGAPGPPGKRGKRGKKGDPGDGGSPVSRNFTGNFNRIKFAGLKKILIFAQQISIYFEGAQTWFFIRKQ